jgi:hypothetical protein
MEGTEKPHMDKYKEITYDRNYDANYMLTSRSVSDLENFKYLIFVAQRLQNLLLVKFISLSFFFASFMIS